LSFINYSKIAVIKAGKQIDVFGGELVASQRL